MIKGGERMNGLKVTELARKGEKEIVLCLAKMSIDELLEKLDSVVCSEELNDSDVYILRFYVMIRKEIKSRMILAELKNNLGM